MNAELAQRILASLYDEWRAGTSEKDQSPTGRLAAIFRDAGWGDGVTHSASGKVNDWCGFTAGAAFVRNGMPTALRNAFWHCMNIEDFATYGSPRLRNPRRIKHEVLVDGVWMKVKDWHAREGKPRTWISEAQIRAGDAAAINIQPADIVLLDYRGIYDKSDDERDDEADHVTVAAELRGGVLEVMNGNASGLDINGKPVSDAVCRTIHDLNDPKARKRLYGIARLSDLDFLPMTYR